MSSLGTDSEGMCRRSRIATRQVKRRWMLILIKENGVRDVRRVDGLRFIMELLRGLAECAGEWWPFSGMQGGLRALQR